MIIIGVLSSIITLLLKALLDYLQEGAKDKRERMKFIFQRKTDVAEKAMSWYQEAIDCFSLMQMSCDDYILGYVFQAHKKFLIATQKMQKLFEDASKSLNPLYTYMDVSQIEQNHNAHSSLYHMNCILNELVIVDQKAQRLLEEGASIDSKEMNELLKQNKPLLENLSKELYIQISSMADIQKTLRKEFDFYSIINKGSFLDRIKSQFKNKERK